MDDVSDLIEDTVLSDGWLFSDVIVCDGGWLMVYD